MPSKILSGPTHVLHSEDQLLPSAGDQCFILHYMYILWIMDECFCCFVIVLLTYLQALWCPRQISYWDNKVHLILSLSYLISFSALKSRCRMAKPTQLKWHDRMWHILCSGLIPADRCGNFGKHLWQRCHELRQAFMCREMHCNP